MSQKRKPKWQAAPLLPNFTPLFYACKFLGIYPHDLQAFQRHCTLQPSKAGSLLVVVVMIVLFMCFTLMLHTLLDATFIKSQDYLGIIIASVLSYIGLAACFTDQLSALRYQKQLGNVFERIQGVDDALQAQDICVSNYKVTLRIRLLIVLTLVFELTLCCYSYSQLLDINEWAGLLVFSTFPTVFNSFDKIWFVNLLMALEQRFEAMNGALEQLVQRHEQSKSSHVAAQNDQRSFIQHLETELALKVARNKVSPVTRKSHLGAASFKRPWQLPLPQTDAAQHGYDSELNNPELLEEKFVQLCQLHSDVCDIARTLNRIWSLPILVLMAYGFLTITASLYYIYAASYNQQVPLLYRSTSNLPVAVFYLFYVANKCIAIMWSSWKTTLECKRMGVCLHKCAVAANTNEVYEIVNHLSLKLLHHGLDFSASEFFTLDMQTLFAICGALTSYLIIFIQFDIAARQAKSGNSTLPAMPTNLTNSTG